ncbi:MAG: hypothetical protein IAG13_11615 [Deltaproteobacteria bacterium]|nr:hypothetical protein [Nannocystaceae bacterium]
MSDRRTQAMIVVAIAGFLGGAAIAIIDHVRGPEPAPTPAPTEPVRTSAAAGAPAFFDAQLRQGGHPSPE